jgi:hypothetical protein
MRWKRNDDSRMGENPEQHKDNEKQISINPNGHGKGRKRA